MGFMGTASEMRIAFILYGVADNRSGGFLYDKFLIQKLQKRGHNVELFSQKEGNYFTLLMGNSKKLLRNLFLYNPDLIIEDELNHMSLFLINKKIKLKVNAPILSIVHHLKSEENINKILRYFSRGIEHSFLAGCDAFIFNSINTLNSVNKLLKNTGKSYKIIYPGKDNLQLLQRELTDDGIVRLIFVGNIIPRKNLDMVLRVLCEFTGLPWRFNICGADHYDSKYLKELHKLAAKFEGKNKIIFNGRVSDKTLTKLLSESDILIAPSKWEGFGISYLEAMRSGVIPIASINGGAVEIIENDRDGFLISTENDSDLENILKKLLNNHEIIKKMIPELTRKADKFSTWDQTMDKAVEFIESVIA